MNNLGMHIEKNSSMMYSEQVEIEQLTINFNRINPIYYSDYSDTLCCTFTLNIY